MGRPRPVLNLSCPPPISDWKSHEEPTGHWVRTIAHMPLPFESGPDADSTLQALKVIPPRDRFSAAAVTVRWEPVRTVMERSEERRVGKECRYQVAPSRTK